MDFNRQVILKLIQVIVFDPDLSRIEQNLIAAGYELMMISVKLMNRVGGVGVVDHGG